MMQANVDYLTGGPHLVMVIEPETKVRFRYKSEGSSHGGLLGKQKKKEKKIYPTVKLEDYYGNKRVYVRVSLCTEDLKQHVIEFIGQNEESTSFIDVYLQEDNTAIFTNLKFLNKKKEEIFQLLLDQRMEELGEKRKAVRAKFEKKNEKELKERAKNIMNSVRLRFEAFEEDNTEVKSICQPLYSELICNQKTASKGELRIHRMSRVSGSWKGGDEVILLCDKVQKDNINIIFYEADEECSGTVEWKENAIFTPADVHYQVAITFKTPQYRMNAEKTVCVCLSRNDEMGEPLQFKYIPDFTGNPSKKRKVYSHEEPAVLPITNYEHSEKSAVPGSQQFEDVINLPMGNNFLKEFDIEMSDLKIDIENLEDLYNDIILHEDVTMAENAYKSQPERIYNQCLDISIPLVTMTETDGGPVGQMNALTIKESFNCIIDKFKSKKHSLSDIHKVKQQIQEKLYSYLMKKDEDSGNTLLHVAVFENKNVTSVLRMSRFANIDIINVKNYFQETALHIATQQNNEDLVKILLQYDSNPNLKNAEGNNCYHEASLGNYCGVMCYLLTLTAYKPELNAFNYEGLTPVHLAVKKKSEECYHLLKLHFADTNILDQKSGRSLLHYAVEYQPQFVKILLEEAEIDINIQDLEGNTPLHIACSKGDAEIIEQLLKAGSDPYLKNFKRSSNMLEENSGNEDGQTPADLTTNLEILAMLRQSSNENPGSDEVMKKLCSLLDVNANWERIVVYFMDEKYIDSLKCSPRPSERLLLRIKKEVPNYIEKLRSALEITGLSEALNIIKEAQF